MSVSIRAAKSCLPQLIAEVERTGQEVVIHRNNTPIAKLVKFHPVVPPRVLGGWEGKVQIADDFDELPLAVAAGFAVQQPDQPNGGT